MDIKDIDFNSAWILVKKAFPVLNEAFTLPFESNIPEDEFYEAINIIKNLKLSETIQTLCIKQIGKYVQEKVTVEFWSYFTDVENEVQGFKTFHKAVLGFYEYYVQFYGVMAKLDLLRIASNLEKPVYCQKNATNALTLIFRATLLSQLPADHTKITKPFYELALKSEETNLNYMHQQCSICLRVADCICSQYFFETNSILIELKLLEPMVGHVLTCTIYECIENHVDKTCKDSFDISHLELLETWLQNVVIKWLKKIYKSDTCNGAVWNIHKKLLNYLCESYTEVRISQLFNIILEFPESLPALEDLRICLPKTDQRSQLIKKIQQSMETRLLHPGVSTPDILTAYVAAIRSMRVLDPSGLLLDTITQPVHQYLRSREDTVRCVVSSLTEDGPNDLADELCRNEGLQIDENTPSDDDSSNWETWRPDPVDADPTKLLSSRRTFDIISMLVNVYGSKELFVNEYRTLLADRLLSQLACDTEKEIRYVELLKLRFGDSQLHYCEVMLKDIADSKRINQHIKQGLEYREDEIPMSAMILSAQFWPAFKEEKCELHQKVDNQFAEYTKAFETLKGNRTLCWKKHLGVVDIEIELPDRTLNLSVTPMHATIIMHFQDKGQWNIADLSRIMQVPPTLLRRKLGFWQSHCLISEISSDVFELVEETKDAAATVPAEVIVEDESESAMASTQDQREEELQTFWSYIIGMLMNLDTLPLERIHQMLKMFAFQGPTIECSLQELRHFLDRKVREHQLVYSAGLYRLPKS